MIKILRQLPLITITLISGCGFAPLSLESFSPKLKQIYYQPQHPYKAFAINFKKRLKSSGITLLPSPEKSKPIIKTNFSYSHGSGSPASTTQARIYTLTYTATITISDINTQTLLSPQTASVTRNITLQPNEVFEATPQIATVKQEMIRELSTKSLNILGAKKTTEALQKLD